jgi:hypothetical protein
LLGSVLLAGLVTVAPVLIYEPDLPDRPGKATANASPVKGTTLAPDHEDVAASQHGRPPAL